MDFEHGELYLGEIANRESSYNRAVGSPLEWTKTAEEPSQAEPVVLKFDDITPKTFGGPHLLDSLTCQVFLFAVDLLLKKRFQLSDANTNAFYTIYSP